MKKLHLFFLALALPLWAQAKTEIVFSDETDDGTITSQHKLAGCVHPWRTATAARCHVAERPAQRDIHRSLGRRTLARQERQESRSKELKKL